MVIGQQSADAQHPGRVTQRYEAVEFVGRCNEQLIEGGVVVVDLELIQAELGDFLDRRHRNAPEPSPGHELQGECLVDGTQHKERGVVRQLAIEIVGRVEP